MKKRQVLSIAIIIVTLAAILDCPPKPKPILAGFVWYIYITFIHKRAFSDVVEGCERFKNTWRGQSIAVNTKIDKSFLAHQDTIQKQSTKRIVDKVQKKLKRKEKV